MNRKRLCEYTKKKLRHSGQKSSKLKVKSIKVNAQKYHLATIYLICKTQTWQLKLRAVNYRTD